MKASNKKNKARKGGKGRGAMVGMPKGVISEVRALRKEIEEDDDKTLDRGVDRGYSNTKHGLQCSICGELGDHACLPLLHEMLEYSEDFRNIVWKAFEELDRAGYFNDESLGVNREIDLGNWS